MSKSLQKRSDVIRSRSASTLGVFRKVAEDLEDAIKEHNAVALEASRIAESYHGLETIHSFEAREAQAVAAKIRDLVGGGK